MPPIIYLNEISDKEKLFINLSIYALWIFYFYEFGSFMRNSFMKKSVMKNLAMTITNTFITLIGTGTACAICFTFYTIITHV